MYTLSTVSKIVKELIKKVDIVLSSGSTLKWKEITDDHTAIISFKLIIFC